MNIETWTQQAHRWINRSCSSWTTRHSVSTFLLFDKVSMSSSSSLFLLFHFIFNCTADTFVTTLNAASSHPAVICFYTEALLHREEQQHHPSQLVNQPQTQREFQVCGKHKVFHASRISASTQGSSWYNSRHKDSERRLNMKTGPLKVSMFLFWTNAVIILSHDSHWISPGCTHRQPTLQCLK